MWGNLIEKRFISFAFEKILHINLCCKLVPVQYREYENVLRVFIYLRINHLLKYNKYITMLSYNIIYTIFTGECGKRRKESRWEVSEFDCILCTFET